MKERAQNLVLTLSDGRVVIGTCKESVKEGEEVSVVLVRASRPFDLPEGYEWVDLR